MIKWLFPSVCTLLLIASCTVDRSFPIPAGVTGPGGKDNIVAGTLVINEFEARGSQFFNELILPGNPNGGVDWIEIYNTTSDTITLEKGKWFLTDSLGDARKFQMPYYIINPRDFMLVWCDDSDTTITQIHSNFSLSKSGEDIGLFYQDNSSEIKRIDALTFGAQQSGISFGRLPDGSANWTNFINPTPGTSNK